MPMYLTLIVLAWSRVSNALHILARGKSIGTSNFSSKELPSCRHDTQATFSSLEEAVQLSGASKILEDGKTGKCKQEGCCCGWWIAPTHPTKAQDLLMLPNSEDPSQSLLQEDSCVVSFPLAALSPPPVSSNECGDFAVTVGGTLRGAEELEKYIAFLGKPGGGWHLDQPDAAKVDFYLHIAFTGGLSKGNEISGIPNREYELPQNLPPYIKGLVVENAADVRVRDSVIDCTNNASETWIDKLHEHDLLYDGGEYTTAYMFRHIFLAHRMARASKCAYKIMMRARPDAGGDRPDWQAISAEVQKGKLLTAIKPGFSIIQVDASNRCELDDTFAFGTPEMMDDYSVLYPDLQNVIPFYPFYRDDHHAVNERLLATHLHLRHVNIGDIGYGYILRRFST